MDKHYIIQEKIGGDGFKPPKWVQSFGPFDTLEEAQERYEKIAFKNFYRIAESYEVIRYRPVK